MKTPWSKQPSNQLVTREFAVGLAHAAAEDAARRTARDFGQMPVSPQAEVAPTGSYGVDDSWYIDLMAGGPDVNPLLTGRAKYQVYNEMRLSDPTVRSCLWMFKLPIRAASWKVTPASEDPVDKLVAEAVAWQFGLEDDIDDGRLDFTWDQSLAQALLYLDFGAMFEEIIWADEMETWYDSDGDPHPVRPISRLAPRFPSSVIRVAHDWKSGSLDWIVQDLPGARPIPGSKLLHYALDREGHNWWGTSLLRPMYGPWRLKKALMIAAGIGWDRHAVGTPVVRFPLGGGNVARQQAEAIARNYRVHERGYVVLEGPAPTAQGGGNLWDIQILNGAGTLADPVTLMKEYDVQIATAGLQMFARLGTTATGSRAVGEVLSDPFYLAVQSIAKSLAAVRTRHAVRQFVTMNFGAEIDTPKFEVSKIQAKNVTVLARAIADLSAAGLHFTDVSTQNDIRDQLDLDHLPDELVAVLEGLPPEVGIDIANPETPLEDGTTPTGEPMVGQHVPEPLDTTGGVTTGAT